VTAVQLGEPAERATTVLVPVLAAVLVAVGTVVVVIVVIVMPVLVLVGMGMVVVVAGSVAVPRLRARLLLDLWHRRAPPSRSVPVRFAASVPEHSTRASLGANKHPPTVGGRSAGA
jgi:hypothetical protein